MKKNRTARALLMSTLSLLLCVSMLVGSTFAWFTDSVVSANNIIKSGNLDIELDYWNGNEWLTVENASDILSEDRYEPGHVQVAYLRLSNVGTLALKYALGVNIITEKPGTNKDNVPFNLSDYIYFDVVEGLNGETNAYATREAAMAVATETVKIKDGYSKTLSMEAQAEPVYLALVVYMPTSVGNQANHNGDAPQIDLGISVVATQFTSELDSFDKYYDALANPWDGQVDTSWYDPAATEFIIDTPEKLAGFAAIVNGTAADIAIDSFQGKTVKLGADIDLGSRNWTPIGDVDADDYVGFRGTFDGQGHTIYNLKIESDSWGQGLFGYLMNKGAVIKNFTMRNARVKAVDTSAVVAGYATYGDFENVHVTGTIAVEGKEHMGGIVGNGYYAKFKGCSVTANGTITATTGSFVGGIVGYQGEGNLSIADCTVKNVNITGYAAVGGIAGVAGASNTIDNCLVENVVLTKTRDGGMPAIGAITGCYTHGGGTRVVTITNCTATNVTLKGNYEAADPNVLCGSEYTSQSGTNFVLDGNAITVDNQLVKKVSVITVNTVDELKDAFATAPAGAVINAEGVTVNMNTADHFVVSGEGVTVQNLTVNANYRGISYVMFEGDDVVFENCAFGNTNRIVALGGTPTCDSVTYNNCTFKGQVITNFVDNANGVATFNNCTFTQAASGGNAYTEAMGGTHYFNNCTFDYTGLSQSSMGILNNASINSCSDSDGSYSTVMILEGCKLINCGRRTYGPNSTLTVK